jgi:phosphoribosylaminoimidazolecarboxamide formyltransferase / IMP cyclohydrolase
MDERRLALLSVSDKRGIETLGRGLVDFGFGLLSTGGTAKAIAGAGLPVTMVSDYTGAPEIMDGRVKTLHPKIHGGILARDTKEHRADLRRIRASAIEIVVVNLYPFEATVASRTVRLPEAVEQIDIGGPCLLRAAAKNFERVTAVCDPADYEVVLWHLARDGAIPAAIRFDLAVKAFGHTAAYDAAVFETLPHFDLATQQRRGDLR